MYPNFIFNFLKFYNYAVIAQPGGKVNHEAIIDGLYFPTIEGKRAISVYLPVSILENPNSRQPVIYVPDGENLSADGYDSMVNYFERRGDHESALINVWSRLIKSVETIIINSVLRKNYTKYVS